MRKPVILEYRKMESGALFHKHTPCTLTCTRAFCLKQLETFEKRYGIHSNNVEHVCFNFLGYEPVQYVYVFMFENNILNEDL